MKHPITQILNLNLVADDTAAKVVRLMSFAVSVLVLALTFWKLSRLDLTEAQLFLGLLLAPITPMLLILLGLLLPLAIAPRRT